MVSGKPTKKAGDTLLGHTSNPSPNASLIPCLRAALQELAQLFDTHGAPVAWPWVLSYAVGQTIILSLGLRPLRDLKRASN